MNSTTSHTITSKNSFVLENNWAFIDTQNLCRCLKEEGWKIDWSRFRSYLRDKLNVTKAVAFLGYIKEYEYLYQIMRKAGFTLEFREVTLLANGEVEGGNVDTDLTSYAMDYKTEYYKAIIVADDRDYIRTVKSLDRQNKLKLILSPHTFRNTSQLIKQAVNSRLILSMYHLRNLIGKNN